MSSLDLDLYFDLDARVSKLELEWRRAFEACVVARVEYDTVASESASNTDVVAQALQRFVKAAELKSQILSKIDRLERRSMNWS